MPRQPKKERLNLFLIKAGLARADAIRQDIDSLRSYRVSEGLNFSGEIKTRHYEEVPPGWLRFLRAGTKEEIEDLRTRTSGALLVISVDERVYCLAWGGGRHWIEDKNIERRFGMIVTLNTVDPNRIRSVDREEFETVTRITRSQLSVSASIDSFGVDVRRDLVRSVTGTPEDPTFAAHVTGSDNLIIQAAVKFHQIGDKCREALRHYEDDRYRQRGFGWIDNFTRVRDRLQISGLESRLEASLRDGTAEEVFLSPPMIIENQAHLGFLYPKERRGSDLHRDLRLDEFFAVHDRNTVTVAWLKDHHIREFANDAENPRKFSIFDAIVYETRIGTKLYVLSQGEWFEIDENHVRDVNHELAQIDENDGLTLPEALPDELEPAYNRRAAQSSGGTLALLDFPEARIAYGGGHSLIEICDLLSANRDFVHVKAKTKSSTLSHLFAQGTISAQAFRDIRFRQLAAAICPKPHKEIFNAPEIRAREHSVTFAVITKAEGSVKEALPFFSKQSLVNAARTLRDMGYQVYVKKIPVAQAIPDSVD